MKTVLWCSLMAMSLCVSGFGVMAQAEERREVQSSERTADGDGRAEIELVRTGVSEDFKTRNANDRIRAFDLKDGATGHPTSGAVSSSEYPAQNVSLSDGGWKLETTYRVSAKSETPDNTLAYDEQKIDTSQAYAAEAKLAFETAHGTFTVAYSANYDQSYRNGKIDHEYDSSVSYASASWFQIGVASTGNYTDNEYAAGPTFAWTGSSITANIVTAYSLNHRTDDRSVRLLFSAPF